jgi:hypothetical protein
MILCVTVVEFLAIGDKWQHYAWLPSQAKYLPELLSAAAAAVVIMLGTTSRFAFVRPAYWIAFLAFLLSMIAGVVANGVDAGPIFAGVRTYLRGVPWFFIAAVWPMTEKDLRGQLLLLAGICVLQVPIAIQQRILTADDYYGFVAVTGDWTVGTLQDSGVLSIFLIGALCVLAAAYERKLVPFRWFLPLFVLMLLPTTINETKGTLVMMPIGLLVAFSVAAEPGTVVKRAFAATGLLVVALAIFVPVYDWLNEEREYGVSIGEFVSNPAAIEKYIFSGAEVGTQGEVGRADAVIIPTMETLQDPVRAAFGVGIGNASESALGAGFTGRFGDVYKSFLMLSYSRFILELGLVGVLLILAVYAMVFGDARRLAATDRSLFGMLAAGWTGFTIVMVLGSLYTKVEVFSSLNFLYWYFSGVIVAARMRAPERVAAALRPVRTASRVAARPTDSTAA